MIDFASLEICKGPLSEVDSSPATTQVVQENSFSGIRDCVGGWTIQEPKSRKSLIGILQPKSETMTVSMAQISFGTGRRDHLEFTGRVLSRIVEVLCNSSKREQKGSKKGQARIDSGQRCRNSLEPGPFSSVPGFPV